MSGGASHEVTSTGLVRRLDAFFFPVDGGRFTALEGLRGWALWMIFHVHFLGYYESRNYFVEPGTPIHRAFSALTAGHAGVDLFLLLTGLLIYTTIHRNHPPLGRFLVNRYWRLFPALFLVNLPLIAMMAKDVPTVIDNLFLLHLFPQTDYLNVVEWVMTYQIYFYILAGIWFIALARASFMQGWPFFFLAVALLYLAHQYEVFGFSAVPRFLSIFWGLALAKLYHSPRTWARLSPVLDRLSPAAPLAVYAARWYWAGNAAAIINGRWQWAAYFGFMDLCFFIIVGAVLTPGSPLRAIFASRPLRMAGAVSYSAFLIHACWAIPVAEIFLKPLPQGLPYLALHYILSIVLTLLTAALMFHFLEKPYFVRRKAGARVVDEAANAGAAPGGR